MTFETVDLNGIHFRVRRNSFFRAPLPERIELPAGAHSPVWDEETLSLLCLDSEGETHSWTLTQPEIDAAQDYSPLAPVPASVTARQLRLWLATNGHDVDAIIAAMPAGPEKDITQIEWEYATIYERANPLVGQIGAALGLDSDDIDQAFREASQL